MSEKYELGKWELSCIMLNALTYKIFTGFPRLFAEISGTGGWLTAIAGGLLAALLAALVLRLYDKTGTDNILNLAEAAGGKVARFAAGGILTVYFLFSNALALREFAEVMKTVAFPSAALTFIMLFFAAAMISGVLCGLDSIARLHILAVPVTILITLAIILSGMRCASLDNLFPILGTGADKMFGKGVVTLSIYSDAVVLFLLKPFSAKAVKGARVGFLSVLGGITVTVAVVLTFVLIVPYPTSADTNIPIYPLVKVVYYGRFFQRLDAFYMLAVAISGMLYLSLSLFFITWLFADLFRLPRSRPMTWSAALLCVLLALTVQRTDELQRTEYLSAYALWGVGFLLPLLCVWTARLRRRGKEGEKLAQK